MTDPSPADAPLPPDHDGGAHTAPTDAGEPTTPAADPPVGVPVLTLDALGVRPGEPVRFRKAEGGRWFAGKIAGHNADGSMTLYDANGAARSLFPDRIEIQRPGVRGRMVWITLADLATTSEQLMLF